jgi:hypothetical protein
VTVVVSVEEKAHMMRQMGIGKASGEVSESFVTVTHPFHPLAGQRLRVLFERKLQGGLDLPQEFRTADF